MMERPLTSHHRLPTSHNRIIMDWDIAVGILISKHNCYHPGVKAVGIAADIPCLHVFTGSDFTTSKGRVK